jgi:hypothetical protein
MAIVQEQPVFEEVEARFCKRCRGKAFAAACAPDIFLFFCNFEAQVGCRVVGFSNEVCASHASDESIAIVWITRACAAEVILQALAIRREERAPAALVPNARAMLRSDGHSMCVWMSAARVLLLMMMMVMIMKVVMVVVEAVVIVIMTILTTTTELQVGLGNYKHDNGEHVRIERGFTSAAAGPNSSGC